MKKDEEIKIYSSQELKKDMLSKKDNRKFLSFYIIGLFSLSMVLILMSYLTQVRANKTIDEQISVVQGTQSKMMTLQAEYDIQKIKLQEATETMENVDISLQKMTQQNQELIKFIEIYRLYDNNLIEQAKEIQLKTELLPIEIVELYNKIIK